MMSRDSYENSPTSTNKVAAGRLIDPAGGSVTPYHRHALERQRRRMTLPVTSEAASEAR